MSPLRKSWNRVQFPCNVVTPLRTNLYPLILTTDYNLCRVQMRNKTIGYAYELNFWGASHAVSFSCDYTLVGGNLSAS
jgi:hypothetical protein